jgi:hypothetical protein
VVKIDTATDTTTLLDARPTDENGCWTDGVLGLDGHIYFMPKTARRILKLNTDTDTIENVGVFFKSGYKCIAAVRGLGGFIYGIPLHSKCIMKFDPVSLVTSYVGEKHNNDFECLGEGALASDGCIYAMTGQFEVLKIDTNKNKMSWALVGNKVDYTYVMRGSISRSIDTANAIAGIDGCVYFPNILTVKYDPHTDHTCFVGNDFGYKQSRQWLSGALAPDGVIYCMPYAASHVLAIDPYREFTESLASEVNQHPPEEFGGLFAVGQGGITKFDSAIAKFGQRGFQTIVAHLPKPKDIDFSTKNLYPFIAAALCRNCPLSVIYYLVCQAPELIPTTIGMSKVPQPELKKVTLVP